MYLRKLLVSRIKTKTKEMFRCTRFRGNTWMSHRFVCHWVLSGSDCSKRALCFSGLNHSGLIKKGLAAQMLSVSQANRQMEVCVVCLCVFVGLLHHCLSYQSFLINSKPVITTYMYIKVNKHSSMYCIFCKSLLVYSPYLSLFYVTWF